MKKTFTVNSDLSVDVFDDHILIEHHTYEEVMEGATQFYEAAGFIPCNYMIESMSYNELIIETIL